ncbi:MAG: sigma-70 family RNA polymerase sigma factor [Anaerolineales bacterium]|jgi:RNA polymerase sigma-70 factor (ECF subfamily)
MEKEQQISIRALRSGDREAFAAMVDEYSPQLYRLALRMLGNPQEAEDVLQETFINAFKHMKQFEGRSQLSTWLYRIAANQALMRLRKNGPDMVSVDEPLQLGGGESVPRQLKDWCCLPEAEFMTSEAQAQLDQAIGELSSALRAAFVLRDLQGLSTRKTAEILDISESAVKTRLLRARLELREKLSAYFSGRVEAIENE